LRNWGDVEKLLLGVRTRSGYWPIRAIFWVAGVHLSKLASQDIHIQAARERKKITVEK
jgi:hypothetical protein